VGFLVMEAVRYSFNYLKYAASLRASRHEPPAVSIVEAALNRGRLSSTPLAVAQPSKRS
jgi:hypothetical protein